MKKNRRTVASKGLTIIYYGRGKGKTTAALGLAARALGAGLNVYMIQFIKGEWPCHERDFFEAFNDIRQYYRGAKKIGQIKIVASGRGFVKILGDKKPFKTHQEAALKALALARLAMRSGKYDLIVLDEAISAVETKLIKTKDLLRFLKKKPPLVHLVMTGHDAIKSLIAKADIVSEIKMIKHPYYQGVLAQRGIDY